MKYLTSSLILKLLFLSVFVILFSCESKDKTNQEQTYSLSGKVQKGPYINGTKVVLYELNDSYAPTGRTFSTIINDDKGSFTFEGLKLISPNVIIDCDGYYFNEVTGSLSNSRIDLNALANLNTNSTVNVNLLTHLEKSRIEYLLTQKMSFNDAKRKALTEILSIFNQDTSNVSSPELLDISGSSAGDAILLAISAILQGTHSEAELTELLTNISTDLKTDGTLDDKTLQSTLINEAVILNTDSVRTNLGNRYKQLGSAITVPDFKASVNQFISHTTYTFTKVISYPETGNFGPNILSADRETYPARSDSQDVGVSMAADIPVGTKVTIRFIPGVTIVTSSTGGDSVVNTVTQKIFSDYAVYGYMGLKGDWAYYDWNVSDHSMVFYNNKPGHIDTRFDLNLSPGTATIEIYENNAVLPTRIKKIKW